MLPVRSRIRTTSTGAISDPPQAPLQAADMIVPVLPLLTPTARPNVYCRVTLLARMIVLQMSVGFATGSHGAQHTTPVHFHCELFAANETLHTPGMSMTRGSPLLSIPMRQANEVAGAATPPKFRWV